VGYNLVGVVGAGIVNDNQFPVRVGLSQYGLYRLGYEPTRVVAGHDYGDEAVHDITFPPRFCGNDRDPLGTRLAERGSVL